MYRDKSESLRDQVITLRNENKALKALLADNDISFAEVVANVNLYVEKEEYDSNQASRIIHPNQITDEMANRFYARFWGRQVRGST